MSSTVLTWSNFPEPINKSYNIMGSAQPFQTKEAGFIETSKNIWDFIQAVRKEGFWMAVYDKPFTEVMGDFIIKTLKAIGIFITGNGDIFFLMPSIAIMTATFLVGRNKWTKLIIPLIFAYFISRAFFRMLL